jgi:hypothetical protein
MAGWAVFKWYFDESFSDGTADCSLEVNQGVAACRDAEVGKFIVLEPRRDGPAR